MQNNLHFFIALLGLFSVAVKGQTETDGYTTNQNTPISIQYFTNMPGIDISSIDLSQDNGIQQDITNTIGRFQIDTDGVLTFSPKVTFNGTTSIDVFYKIQNIQKSETLKFRVVPQDICSQSIKIQEFKASNGVKEVFDMPATDYGFQFDITALDNSFNLTINGTSLITDTNYGVNDPKRHELEFQSDQTLNVKFEDDTYWGNGSISHIYQLAGSDKNPIVRVLISPEGKVSLYGSKTSNGPLKKLKLINNAKFNTITWNTTAPNTVIANQRYVSTTYMNGVGTGLKVRSCPCVKEGLAGTTTNFTQVGISTLDHTSDKFPTSIPNGFLALESKDKGLVLSRIQNSAKISNPVKGMLIYDIDSKCVKMYNGKSWVCLFISCNVHSPEADNTHIK